MSIGYPEPKAYLRPEPINSPITAGVQKSGVATQLEQIEHLLNVQEEILAMLNSRLMDALKPLNVPIRGTAAEDRKGTGNSLLVDQLSRLAERVELHNTRLSHIIDAVDL